jgi:hypothetical protein
MMTKRIVVDDIQKKDGREQEKALRVKLSGKLGRGSLFSKYGA